MTRELTLAAAAAVLLSGAPGCVTKQTHYQWGNYDEALYANYKNPQDRQAFVASLKTIILQSEKTRGKAPPGVYAEYGYALFEEGNGVEAIVYFKKERDAWPESREFMEKMISNAQRTPPKAAPASSPPPTGPATALEKETT